MTEQTPDYRTLLYLMGYPPIMGGAPDEEPAADKSETDAPESQESDKANEEESFTDSFKPDELPEEARAAYEKAYNEMRGDYSRKTAELAEQRKAAREWQQFGEQLSNPETQAQALAHLGLEIQDTEGEFLDPEEELKQRLAALEQDRVQQYETQRITQQEEQELAYLGQQLESLEQKEGREFTDEEAELIAATAIGSPSNGLPDVGRAYQLLTGAYSERQKSWAEQKKAPRPLGGGRSASKEIDMSDREARIQAQAQAAESIMASQ